MRAIHTIMPVNTNPPARGTHGRRIAVWLVGIGVGGYEPLTHQRGRAPEGWVRRRGVYWEQGRVLLRLVCFAGAAVLVSCEPDFERASASERGRRRGGGGPTLRWCLRQLTDPEDQHEEEEEQDRDKTVVTRQRRHHGHDHNYSLHHHAGTRQADMLHE